MKSNWIKFTGDYEKKWYDIRMNNGMTILDCWPNAGMFHGFDSDYIPFENVSAYRETDDPLWRAVDVKRQKMNSTE